MGRRATCRSILTVVYRGRLPAFSQAARTYLDTPDCGRLPASRAAAACAPTLPNSTTSTPHSRRFLAPPARPPATFAGRTFHLGLTTKRTRHKTGCRPSVALWTPPMYTRSAAGFYLTQLCLCSSGHHSVPACLCRSSAVPLLSRLWLTSCVASLISSSVSLG